MMAGMQVIRMLRGAHDPGPAFCLDKRNGSFSVMQHTHVPHMSHRSLLHMLKTFAAAGTDLLRCAVQHSAFCLWDCHWKDGVSHLACRCRTETITAEHGHDTCMIHVSRKSAWDDLCFTSMHSGSISWNVHASLLVSLKG